MTTSVGRGTITIQDQTTFVTNMSFSHTNDGDFLLVRVMFHGNSVIVSGITATYGGVSMTFAAQSADNTNYNYAFMFLLRAPAMGANTLSLSWTGSARGSVVALSLLGVGNAGYRTYAAANGSVSPVSVSPTSLAGDLVFDAIATTVTTSLTAGAGQTEEKKSTITDVNVAASYKIGTATSTTLTWTESINKAWVSVGIAFFGLEIGGVTVSPTYWI